GLSIFFEGYGRSLIVITLSYVGRDLGAAPAELSWALALVSVGSLGVLVLGPIADRFGRRRLVLASVGLLALFGAGAAMARALAALVVWQAAARMFQEGALFTSAVIGARRMPAAHRGTAQGLLGTARGPGYGCSGVRLASLDRL